MTMPTLIATLIIATIAAFTAGWVIDTATAHPGRPRCATFTIGATFQLDGRRYRATRAAVCPGGATTLYLRPIR